MGQGKRTIRLVGLQQGLDEPDEALLARALARVGLARHALDGARIARRSVDARARPVRLPVQVDLVLPRGFRSRALDRELKRGRVREAAPTGSIDPGPSERLAGKAVVVVGSGPAGMFAALPLALAGARVTLLERGAELGQRHKRLVPFHRGGPLDPETNLLFGEGGAGTYSDGKLYTRVDDPLEVPILEELVAAGAPPEILFDARAHIGTDRLHLVLPALRERLRSAGVEFAFGTRFEELVLHGADTVRAVRTSQGELPCDVLIMAPGHSARDTLRRLAAQGVPFEPKPFQFGVRIEHPQDLVTAARYGSSPEVACLGAASYTLTSRASAEARGAHSFCMCPGGKIVASVEREGLLCTNGMSNSTHSSRWANSGLVVTLQPEDYGGTAEDPFAGIAFQEEQERAAFEAGGGTYAAPAQRAEDFLTGRPSLGDLPSSLVFGASPARLDQLLPTTVTEALQRALVRFERVIPGYAGSDGILHGVESRSSGPVRIPRGDSLPLVRGFTNLAAVGEGAGWAGGIMSAALDGAKVAQALALGRVPDPQR